MATKFTPVKLTKGDKNRTAETAADEAKLRFDGWRSAPSSTPDAPAEVPDGDKPAEAPKPAAKPAAPAPKN